jgi:hypothetical protein
VFEIARPPTTDLLISRGRPLIECPWTANLAKHEYGRSISLVKSFTPTVGHNPAQSIDLTQSVSTNTNGAKCGATSVDEWCKVSFPCAGVVIAGVITSFGGV